MKNLTQLFKVFTIFVLLLAISTQTQAANNAEKDAKRKPVVAIVLSAEESDLETTLDNELDITVEEVINSLTTEIKDVLVYNMDGNLVESKDVIDNQVSVQDLPANATLLMTEGTTEYYIITE